MEGIDHNSLLTLLEAIDSSAEQRHTICVIGAAALILLGQPERRTRDIDVWRAGSHLVDSDLSSVASAGRLPKDLKVAPLRMISPGAVNLPSVQGDTWATGDDSLLLWQGRKLTVNCPPPPIIAASKLLRASAADIDDFIFLIGTIGVSSHQIPIAAEKFLGPDRQIIARNIPLVDVTLSVAERRATKRTLRDDLRTTSKRDDWVAGVGLLKHYLSDDLALARLMKDRRWSDLAAVAKLARDDVDHDLACTDPVRYKTLRDSITKYHLRGYGSLDVTLLRQRAARDVQRQDGAE